MEDFCTDADFCGAQLHKVTSKALCRGKGCWRRGMALRRGKGCWRRGMALRRGKGCWLHLTTLPLTSRLCWVFADLLFLRNADFAAGASALAHDPRPTLMVRAVVQQPLLSRFDGLRALDDQAMLSHGHALFQDQFAIGCGLQGREMVDKSHWIRDYLVKTFGLWLLLALRRGRRPICCRRRQIQADDTRR